MNISFPFQTARLFTYFTSSWILLWCFAFLANEYTPNALLAALWSCNPWP